MNADLNSIKIDYKKLEISAHIWVDDVMHKVTQEVWELIETPLNWGHDNI